MGLTVKYIVIIGSLVLIAALLFAKRKLRKKAPLDEQVGGEEQNCGEKIVFRVYGEDKFAHETYHVGDYATEAEARAVVEKCRKSVMDQSEGLRDSFWVSRMGEEDVERAREREEEERQARLAARRLETDELRRDMEFLLADIRSKLAGKALSYAKSTTNIYAEDAVAIVKNNSGKVCYDCITLAANSFESGNLCIDMSIVANGCKLTNALKFFKTEDSMRDWLQSPQAVEDGMAAVEKLINEFF